MQLEDRQVIGRCLDDSLQPRCFVAMMPKRTAFGAKDGFDAFEVKHRPQTVDQTFKELLHLAALVENQIATQLHLIDSVLVLKVGQALLIG